MLCAESVLRAGVSTQNNRIFEKDSKYCNGCQKSSINIQGCNYCCSRFENSGVLMFLYENLKSFDHTFFLLPQQSIIDAN